MESNLQLEMKLQLQANCKVLCQRKMKNLTLDHHYQDILVLNEEIYMKKVDYIDFSTYEILKNTIKFLKKRRKKSQ